jgi:NADP-dependent 3-hydroxy acid dehydrogenase YdfG
MQDIDGKTALVTGASSGIGKATVHRLAEEGVNIVLASRSREELEQTAQKIEEKHEVETLVAPTDVTEYEQVEEMIDSAVDEFGALDIVVNNAGLAMTGDIEEMPVDHYETTNGVNIDGMFYTAKEALPHVKETEGNIVFLGSIAGQYPRGPNPVYAASKAWTISFAKSLSAQVGDEGVAVTVVNPSEVRTDFNSEEGTAFRDAFEEGSVSEPEDIADAIYFAVSQQKINTAEQIDLYRRDKLKDMELG